MPNFSGHVIFCEDVRAEVNRQLSYIGVYPFNREFFEPDDEGEFLLTKFGIGVYLQISPGYEGCTPYITVKAIDMDGRELQIADETMGKIPASDDGKAVQGITHIQLEGLVDRVGTSYAIDVTINEDTVRVGLFHTLERDKKEKTED